MSRSALVNKCILIVLAILVGILAGGCSMGNGEKTKKIQEGMKQYLDQKYEREFLVGEPRLTGNAGSGYHVYQAPALVKGEKGIAFIVRWETGEPGLYTDGYLNALWTHQSRQEMANLLKEVYGEEIHFEYDFYFHSQHKNKLDKSEYKLDYSDIVKKYGSLIRTETFYYIFSDADIDKKVEAERAYQVLKRHILDSGIKSYFISMYFMPRSYKEQFMERLKGKIDFNSSILRKEKHLFNALFLNDELLTKEKIVSKPEDIIPIFEY